MEKKKKVKQYWNKCSLSNRNVLEDGLVWKAKLCAKLPKSKQKWPISSEMAAVQEGILYAMEVSTSWSQGLKCTVLERLTKTTSHHLLSKSNHNCRQQKKSFKSFSQYCLSISLSSVSNTGKTESPKPGQHKVAADSLHDKFNHWRFRRQTMQCKVMPEKGFK